MNPVVRLSVAVVVAAVCAGILGVVAGVMWVESVPLALREAIDVGDWGYVFSR